MRRCHSTTAGLIALILTAMPAAAVVIDCEPASGPAGGQIVVTIRVASQEGEVVGGTQNLLSFDNTILDASAPNEGSPNCEINPDIGFGTGPDKILASSFPPATPDNVLGIVFAQNNQSAIPDGALYSCILQVAANAPLGTSSVEILDPIASDPAGDRLPATAMGCQLEITDPPTPTSTPTPEGFCEEDGDCPDDQVCVGNQCATPTPPGFCRDTSDCPVGEVCLGERCATLTPTLTPSPPPTSTPTQEGFCQGDGDCPDGGVCVDNSCATPTPEGFCESNESCDQGELCVENRCQVITPTPIGFCENDQQCLSGERCIDNQCTEPTPTVVGGGGGSCSCSVDPDPPARAMLNVLLALLPVVWLRYVRRKPC